MFKGSREANICTHNRITHIITHAARLCSGRIHYFSGDIMENQMIFVVADGQLIVVWQSADCWSTVHSGHRRGAARHTDWAQSQGGRSRTHARAPPNNWCNVISALPCVPHDMSNLTALRESSHSKCLVLALSSAGIWWIVFCSESFLSTIRSDDL